MKIVSRSELLQLPAGTVFICDDGTVLPIIVHPPQTLADVHAAIARVNEPIHRANTFRNRRRKRR